MSRQPNRLAATEPHKFAGTEIDRSKPLSFRLNGRVIDGFAGDTVLSAVLAAGIATFGLRAGEPIELSERFAPAVVPAASADDPAAALPMERMPALAGLDLVTLGSLRERLAAGGLLARLRHLLLGPSHTLNLRLDDPGALLGSWRHRQPVETLETGTVVIGGGVAGMSAAAAAATAGDSVILLERTPVLGGDARFFGAVENEEAPDGAIRRLTLELSQMANVSVLTRTEAFALNGTNVRAHRIEVDGERVVPRALAITAKRVVLATGAIERRPVFPGNRAPGVSTATAAYHRATRYGVWLGRRALFNTSNNFGYRLALLAKDAGVNVLRITDTRLNPQSRFVDFVKASGITLASSLVPKAAIPAKSGLTGLSVGFAVAIEDISQETAPIHADQFIVAGNWQPELSLWLMAGGRCGWNTREGWLEAQGGLEHVAVAGSAAGYRNNSACLQSGRTAIAQLIGRQVSAVDDRQIDPIFETPDGRPAAAPHGVAGKCRSYLGGGYSFATRAPATARRDAASAVALQRQALDLDEVAASVQTGELPAHEAGPVASERCLEPAMIVNAGWRLSPPAEDAGAAPAVPSYLVGRFGPKPQLQVIGAADARQFEIGCLVFSSADEANPANAVGVVVGPAPDGRTGGLAVVARKPLGAAARLFVRDSGGPVPIELRERAKAEPPSD